MKVLWKTGVLIKSLTCTMVCLGVVSCASMSDKECLNADWNMIGNEDASFGKPRTTLSTYRKDCAKVNVVPDAQAYEKGYKVGLLRFCTYQNGYKKGVAGAEIHVQCPTSTVQSFSKGYKAGSAIYKAARKVKSLEQKEAELKEEMAELDASIEEKENFLVGAEGRSEDRRQALDEIKNLKLEWQLLDEELHSLEDELAWERDQLESLRNNTPTHL